MFKPRGKLSPYVQAIWSLTVSKTNRSDLTKWLQVDACSGILFNLTEAVYLDDHFYSEKVILLPVEKQAHSMTWPQGTKLTGIRFHPGVSFGVFNELYEQPFAIQDSELPDSLQQLLRRMKDSPSHFSRLIRLYRWLDNEMPFSDKIAPAWRPLLNWMRNPAVPADLPNNSAINIPIGQRQIERQFRQLLGMTPKQFQRIKRLQNTQNSLKQQPDIDLAELALIHGFSDQAHMTREFKQIARITPQKYRKQIIFSKRG
ncbi:helix-turn-helix domain-containing protein [Thiomicrorhabdus heinhorstiae]|uniref:AraC family transcriptional regulator n=1 Tax=Thiomicrorhabdus heinhorstiae TaxID=2748010 RepID=A0ABS0BXK4_9GAMM|nr:helix-turn-helix domain-containing protein [Thiomicrorhabdus heinhorstiae]MBF6058119.1 AraC family transcriptional regulator [Thiomicrorhabdus heinhorstiae]